MRRDLEQHWGGVVAGIPAVLVAPAAAGICRALPHHAATSSTASATGCLCHLIIASININFHTLDSHGTLRPVSIERISMKIVIICWRCGHLDVTLHVRHQDVR